MYKLYDNKEFNYNTCVMSHVIKWHTSTPCIFVLQGMPGLAQQPMYANLEDFQYLQQRLPPNLVSRAVCKHVLL